MRKILLFLFSHRMLALLRWDLHFLGVRFLNTIFFRTVRLRKRVNKQKGPFYLNLGSGPRGLNSGSWLNIDGFQDKNVHYLCDLSRPLPFPARTFDGIFCEHVIEHFTYEDGRKLMMECRRILKDKGVIRVIVPNGRKFLTAYFEDPDKIVQYKEVSSGIPMEAVNSWFYQRYEHQCIYDADFLKDSLLKAGFSAAGESTFQHSSFDADFLLLDDPKYSWESLYVEAVK